MDDKLSNNFIFKENHVVCFDVDDTLVIWNIKNPENTIPFNNYGTLQPLEPHIEHINQLKYFSRRNWFVIVWSQGGFEWADEVVNTLGLKPYVNLVLAKPKFYYDDLNCIHWLGNPEFIESKGKKNGK